VGSYSPKNVADFVCNGDARCFLLDMICIPKNYFDKLMPSNDLNNLFYEYNNVLARRKQMFQKSSCHPKILG
jgi:hypothetical protein